MFLFVRLLHLLHKIFTVGLAYFVPSHSLAHMFHKIIQLFDNIKCLNFLISDAAETKALQFLKPIAGYRFLSIE
jgi:hypothetical protein